MDQLTAMRVFARVVETGNFTRASEMLDIPKATVTTLVQNLEGHLKTKLLNRTTRQVVVTTDGAAYYERIVRILTELDELDASFSHSQARPAGKLRVEMAGVLSDMIVIPALPAFRKRFPDIQVDIGVSDRVVDYLAENVDCAIRAGPPKEQTLVARHVGQVGFATCASPAYIAKRGRPSSVHDLKSNHDLIGYLQAQGRVARFEGKIDGEPHDFQPRHVMSAGDGRSCLVAALSGLGVFQAPELLVQPALAGGKLERLLEDWVRDPLSLYLVFPPNRHLSNKVRVFADWVIELLGVHGQGRKVIHATDWRSNDQSRRRTANAP